jgi:hypothetical protein
MFDDATDRPATPIPRQGRTVEGTIGMDIARIARFAAPVAVGIGAGFVAKNVLDDHGAKGSLPAAIVIGAAAAGGASILAGRFPRTAMIGALALGGTALLSACGKAPSAPAGPKPIMPKVHDPGYGTVDPSKARMPDGAQQRPDNVFIEESGGKKFLRFDSMVGNIGEGALQVASDTMPDNTTKMYQVLFNKDGTRQEVNMDGQFVSAVNPEHAHLHWEAFEKYELFKADGSGNPVEAVGDNKKASFYITNIRQIGDAPASGKVDFTQPAAKRAAGITTNQQGISAGWADVYGSGIAGQDIDITGMAPGRYVLRQTFDPENRIAEKDENNNVLDTLVEITADGKANIVKAGYPLSPDAPVSVPDPDVAEQ